MAIACSERSVTSSGGMKTNTVTYVQWCALYFPQYVALIKNEFLARSSNNRLLQNKTRCQRCSTGRTTHQRKLARVRAVCDGRMEHIRPSDVLRLHEHGWHVRQRARVHRGNEDVLHESIDLPGDQREARAETSVP